MEDLEELRRYLASQGDTAKVERLDQISLFLEPTKVAGQESYDNPRKPLVSKEMSVGNIKEEHMKANMTSTRTALEFLDEGQIGLARFIMKCMQSEYKQTMSIEGEFIKSVTKQEFRYEHTQHLHQHLEKDKKGKIINIGGER